MRKMMVVVVVVVVMFLMGSYDFPVMGQMLPLAECKGDVEDIIKQCQAYVKTSGSFVPPSEACCHAIQGADVPCMCRKYVSKALEKLIDMKKAVYVADKCHRPFSHKAKCGDYTVPAAV